MKTFNDYAPLLERVTPPASEQFRKGNYARLFGQAAARVRAWE